MPDGRHIATYADLEALPEHVVGEVIDGELVTHPRPRLRHGVATSSLHGELVGPFQRGREGPGGWLFIGEPELHFGAEVVVPDIAAWRRERMPTVADVAWTDIAPDWVCETLSPATARYDQGPKRALYGRVGVQYLWFLDPERRLLQTFERAETGHWLVAETFADEDKVTARPFDAITFDLAALWPFGDTTNDVGKDTP